VKTPDDLRKIDDALVRFWSRYGTAIDWTLCAACLAWIAWYVGYLMGQASR
jgi:hypothetical protein